MNNPTMSDTKALVCNEEKHGPPKGSPRKGEMMLWASLLALANLSLLNGKASTNLAFFLPDVEGGQWWRVFTFPFVHVSWYNLILDGSAFLLLYHGIEEEKRSKRLFYVLIPTVTSLLYPLLFSPLIERSGLCGLSGCAHGLMAITGLELIRRYPKGDFLHKTGLIYFLTVFVKSIIEATTGQVLFAGLHFGDVGLPIAESHLGGLLGGIVIFFFLNRKNGLIRNNY
ncbi:MAG: rhombosortase [Proteobacteria bacterium]|nr:rhombosortase [Pseudomonadota bacterium]